MESLKKMLEQLKELEKAIDTIVPKLSSMLNLVEQISATGIKMVGPQPK